ncbi:MAG: 2-C-methyl-D-erythritol 4-phosphate cytidylyltransferase [Flavobacteriales bacterium]|nr:2-C-methyl-D-erythritol 4-phosphate cytidylyltransferase [Flavobacteriales bacterium]
MKQYIIIVAGGSGSRMGSTIPKQFLDLNSKPILMHTINKMHQSLEGSEIILALPKSEFGTWKSLCQQHQFDISHQLVEGGNTRFKSVKNALQKISEKSVIAVHDGVRPLVKESVVKQCMQTAKDKGATIPVLEIEESLRQKTDHGSTVVNRDDYLIVQTPQCFTSEILLEAYQQKYTPSFTDDASVVEAMGIEVQLIQGNKENIKITTQEDLKIAEIYTSL